MTNWSRITTDDAGPPGDRMALWADSLWNLLGRLRSNTVADPSFRGSLVHGDVGSLRMCWLSASRHQVERTPDLIRQDDRGFLKVLVQIEGQAWLEQFGRRTLLSAGDWSIYDTARPYTVANTTDVEQLLLLVPREKIQSRQFVLEDALARPYSARTGVGRLACNLMRSAFDEIPACGPEVSEGVADSITQLLRNAMLAQCGRPNEVSARAHLRDQIQAYIETHLGDPDLSIDRLAAAFNCSKRNLHKAFSGEGSTISSDILRQRLERCRRDLADPRHADHSITDVAFSWGFNSATHFSRAFKEAYQLSPQAYRQSLRTAGAALQPLGGLRTQP